MYTSKFDDQITMWEMIKKSHGDKSIIGRIREDILLKNQGKDNEFIKFLQHMHRTSTYTSEYFVLWYIM